MTGLQPTPILPSNAPPCPDGVVTRSSRVLQEQSGNRQHDFTAPSLDQKYPFQSENSYPAYHIPQPAFISPQTPRQHNHPRHSHHRLYHGHRDSQQIRREARYLFQCFQASDNYIKYRERPQKDSGKGPKPPVWPDRIEYAFFEALVTWLPMGRRKLFHNGKLRGRNELIADYIFEQTGESRCRKQVSSHIQVIKSLVGAGNSQILHYLSKRDLSGHPQSYFQQARGYHSTDGRGASEFHWTGPIYATGGAPPFSDAPDLDDILSCYKNKLSLFEPKAFEMFVQCRDLPPEQNPLHRYTANIPTPLQPELRPDWGMFIAEFPLLAAMHSARPIDCNVLSAEASIAFPEPGQNWKDMSGIELGISLTCATQYLPQNAQILCSNRFYRNGELLKGHGSTDLVPMDAAPVEGRGIETQLKFGSTFWARTLACLANRLKATDDPEAAEQDREDVKQYLKDTTAFQEIVIRMPNHTVQRLLMISWKFRLSSAREGRTYWRPIKVPSPIKLEPLASFFENDPYAAMNGGRVDSVYDCNSQSYTDTAYSTSEPASLQSPFEYDNSGSNSALAPAPWSQSTAYESTDGTLTAPQSATDAYPPSTENSFVFSGGNINISYDAMDLSTLDAAAFDFNASQDFVTDPNLESYGGDHQQDFTHQQQDLEMKWYDGNNLAAGGSGSQQTQEPPPLAAQMTVGAASEEEEISRDEQQQQQHHFDFNMPTATSGMESQLSVPAYDDYSNAAYHEQQYSQEDYGASPHEAQAYGGAGEEVMVKVEGSQAYVPSYMDREAEAERDVSQGYDEQAQERQYHGHAQEERL